VLIRRECWLVKHKRMEDANLPTNRPRRRKAAVTQGPSVVPTRWDQQWRMLFCYDQLHEGRMLRVLSVVDQYTHKALATETSGSFSAHYVIDVLIRLSRPHRKPPVI
jgi:putative transposase